MESSKHVLITGGSGLLGRRLTQILEAEGFETAWLSRRSDFGSQRVFQWDVEAGLIDPEALKWAHHIIHLAGEGIAEKSWTAQRKEELLQSRVKPANLLGRKISERGGFHGRIICASAVGYYGALLSERVFSEEDQCGSDFMADVCRQWEAADQSLIDQASAGGAILRIGIVLSAHGGALPKLAGPVRYFAGARLGTGKQIIPWIHLDDVCRMFLHMLMHREYHGIFNAVAPQGISHDNFMNSVGKVLRRPLFLPHVPEFLLSAFLGEMSVMVTKGVSVSAEKIRNTGFEYLYPQLEEALRKELN